MDMFDISPIQASVVQGLDFVQRNLFILRPTSIWKTKLINSIHYALKRLQKRIKAFGNTSE